jgi:hypothetical protein
MIYNTGKVKIGLHYTPPVRPADIGRDMMRLQTALLARPKTLWQRIARWLEIDL